MSKADDILSDELDPDDLDPTPRGGKHGRGTDDATTTVTRLAAGLGLAAVVTVTVLAALGGLLDAGLDAVRPTAPYAVPTLPAEPETPAVRPSCEEPHSGCPQRGDAVEARWSR